MKTKTAFVFTICLCLLAPAFKCKKTTDDVKNKKTKESKPQKEKQLHHKYQEKPLQTQMKESQNDGNEPCMAKMKMKAEKHRESKADSVIIPIPEDIVSTKTHESEQHVYDAELLLDSSRNHHQQKINNRPKSLKVLNAHKQCKMECKKKRDNIETQEYVEHLRSELAAAEEALAAESVDPVTVSISTTEEAREVPLGAN